MFSLTNLPTRRTFLERSALGAGSLLLAPLLLDSCTDHTIPPTDPRDIPWPVTDTHLNWNDASKTVVVTGLNMIPEVGEVLGGLADIFWPNSKEDVWGEVKAQTEAMVNQKIADFVYQLVTEDLQGLNLSLNRYLTTAQAYQTSVNAYQADPKKPVPDPTDLRNQWNTTVNMFIGQLPHFQSVGYELPLLGLFAQFANMFLSILRDGVIAGKGWGRSDADHQNDIVYLKDNIQDFVTYTTNTYNAGRTHLVNATPTLDYAVEPFRTVNTYDRRMTLTILDFRDSWPYLDVTQYPTGAKDFLVREIYSDPYGTLKDNDTFTIVIPKPAPTQFPTQLTVWAYDRFDAVQLTYPQGSGPGGVTQTPRMGAQSGSSNQFPYGGIFTPSFDNPITLAAVSYGDIVNWIRFQFNDGTKTYTLGGKAGSADMNTVVGYINEAISSIYASGVFLYYGSAGCIVFGFKYWQSPAATLKAIQTLYITSPKERSWVDFAKAFPKLIISADLITDALKVARKAYWELMKAKGPK